MTRRAPSRRLLAVLAALALSASALLAGCSGDDASPADPAAAPTGSPNTPDDADRDAVTGAACLVGTWVADNDYFLTSIRELGDEITDVSGEVVVVFGDDGSLTTTYDGWLITATVDGMASTIERSGTDTGVFDADDATVTLSEQQVTSVLQVSAGGHTMTVPADPIDYTGAAYSCSSSEATVSTPDGTLVLTRR